MPDHQAGLLGTFYFIVSQDGLGNCVAQECLGKSISSGEMAKWIKVLSVKSDDLNAIPQGLT